MGSNPELQKFFPVDNVTLAYRALPAVPVTSLPTILMIHPYLTDSSFFNRQFNDPQLGGQAGSKWNLIAIDFHGHGETSGRMGYTFKETAEDTTALLVCSIKQIFSISTNRS